jgi:hypothetical protein
MRGKLVGLLTVCFLSALAPSARAQFGYPFGYGGFGWGGFSANVGYGAEAAGLGLMASGMGSYNVQTAQANSINVNTAMQLNEYMYESIRQRDARIMAGRERRRERNNEAIRETEDRLRNNPTQNDIYMGNALNVVLTELSDPRYSGVVGSYASRTKITGSLIRAIPFNSARAAVTFGLGKLTEAEPGPVFARPEFAADVAEFRKLGTQLREQGENEDTVDPATVKQFRAVIQRAADRLKGLTDVDSAQRSTAQVRIKALLGLSYMLDSPSLDIFLAELRGDQEIGLDRLLAFMRSFNLRFGIASTPAQKQAYDTLFPMLTQLRSEAFGTGTGTRLSDPPSQDVSEKHLENFFSGMALDELHPETHPGPPKPPAPANN